MADESRLPGLAGSLQNIVRSTVAVVRNRAELFSVEFEEQKLRLTRIFVLAGIAVFLGNTAILAISALIVILAGEQARVAVLLILSALYVAGTIWAALALKKELRTAPPAFQDSISELKKDAESLNRPRGG